MKALILVTVAVSAATSPVTREGACEPKRVAPPANKSTSKGAGRPEKPVQLSPGVRRALQGLNQVAPWPSFPEKYTAANWRSAIQTARLLQKADRSVVSQALEQNGFLRIGGRIGGRSDMTSALLVLRLMFNLPEDAAPDMRFTHLGWGTLGPRSHEEREGKINLAWPITWNRGNPRLVTGFWGYEGGPYCPSDEYQFLLERYPFRNLDEYDQAHPHNGAAK